MKYIGNKKNNLLDSLWAFRFISVLKVQELYLEHICLFLAFLTILLVLSF